ncbi:Putative Mitochondrial ATPase complex subunit ATP10 [[Torrubiella] hemipterigena]|uniref:Putative Mitochondrial ATPase complex subunit ATP10 n=1 Tax=[Torrubiella] hemipterigena TaxID=1531966 RepID=A0A0A1SU03_9HYPO|nr:Putative Mitochondrial ATPase complex subunit ATP10 [[Torrubiella] hemipterigena]
MSSRRVEMALMSLGRRPLTCLYCQSRRSFTSSALRAARPEKPAAGTSFDPKSDISGPAIEAPRSYGKKFQGEFTPMPLPRPIGMPLPPRPGENTGVDNRTREQRKKDFSDYDKHLERRKELTAKLARPYFRDWGNLQHHKGKSFIAPPRLFKAEVSLFFPNLYGQTILKDDKEPRDTTPLMTGRATVVSIFSSQWAESQVATFASKEANPALHEVLAKNPTIAQHVNINYEDNAGKAWLVSFFMGSLRKRFPERDWDKYFLVRGGITDNIRESIGLLNSKVGYTYLVDQHCRIRWAGSGPSEEHERESLAKGLAKLVDDIGKEAKLPASAREQSRGKEHLVQQKA